MQSQNTWIKIYQRMVSFLFSSLPVDVSMAVFTIGARTQEGWDFLFEKYRSSLQMSVKSRLKSAMSFSPLQDKLKWCVHYPTVEHKLILVKRGDFKRIVTHTSLFSYLTHAFNQAPFSLSLFPLSTG